MKSRSLLKLKKLILILILGLISNQLLAQNNIGIFSRTPEQHSKHSSKGGKNTNSQKWECLETGFITNPGNLTKYQKARGIDTSKRKRIS